MKKQKAKLYKSVVCGAIFSISTLMMGGFAHAAGTATLVLGTASGSYEKNKTFSIVITENSYSEAVNVVEADFTYDQAKLQFVSADGSGSDFDFPIASSGGSGTIQIARGVSAGGTVTGVKKFATLNFTAIETGSAVVVFAGSSAVIRPSDGANIWNGSTVGGTYTITAPAPAATPSTTTTPAATAKTTPAPVVVTPAASPVIINDQPVPATANVSDDGYLIAIQVFEKGGLPIAGALVKLDNKASKTDVKGVATFANIKPGEHTVKVSGKESKVTVVAGDKKAVQYFAVKGTKPFKFAVSKLGLTIAIIVAACAAVFAALVVRRRIVQRCGIQGQGTTMPQSVPPLTTEVSQPPAVGTVLTPQQPAASDEQTPPTPPPSN